MNRSFIIVIVSAAALIGVIAGLVLILRKASTAVSRQAPDSDLAMKLTPTGVVLSLCLVGSWTLGLAARSLTPESPLGQFLSDARGVVAGAVGSIAVFGVLAVLFGICGSPIVKSSDRDA